MAGGRIKEKGLAEVNIERDTDVQITMIIYNEIQEAKKKEAFEALNSRIMIS